jgi:iron-sulfur cluster repair protein YtfE (RIC family)
VTSRQTRALQGLLAHHRRLGEGMQRRVAAVMGAAAAGGSLAAATSDLLAYLSCEVLPHAYAEEDTVYRAAAGQTDLAGTISEMITEHRVLATAASRLAGGLDDSSALMQAKMLSALMTSHVVKENEVLLPALLADDSVDLADLLERLQERLAESPEEQAGRTGPRVIL